MVRTFLTTVMLAPMLWGRDDIISPLGIHDPSLPKEKKISFTIEGKLKDFKNKKAVVHIGWQEPWEHHEFLKVDMIDGKFKATGEITQPTVGSIRIVTYNDSLKPEQQFPWDCDRVEIFICGGKTTITGKDSLITAKVISNSGCREQELFQHYTNDLASVSTEIDSITAEWQKATARKDSCTSKALDYKYALSLNKKYLLYQDLILQHPASYVSIQLLNAFVYEVQDRARLNLARSLFNQLSTNIRTSPIAVAVNDRLDQKLYPIVGKRVQPLLLTNNEGKKIDMGNYKGKVLLIDFWASWCVPCIKQFPELRTLYAKYKHTDFEVVGISIDLKKNLWLDAIKKNKLEWPQLIDEGPAWGGKASRQFRVQAVPAKFLVNKDGVIIAKDPAMDQLEAKIKALLEK